MTSKPIVATGHALRLAAVGVAAAAALTMAACGSSGNKSSSATTAASAAPSAGGQGTMVTVDESEFKITLSTTAFSPGTYTFVAKNTGHATHSLTIAGPGLAGSTSANVSPGGSTMLTVTLQKGSYELYCPIDGHKSQGMDTRITVG
jgi:uncharacterized cupredoxin-like copper-binding protein